MSANHTIVARDRFPLRAHDRAVPTVVETIFRFALRALRRPDPAWFALNDHLLADIGEKRAEAEVEAARGLGRTPLGEMAEGCISRGLARPRLPSSRLD